MDFEEVREYQAGDDVRNIDWNVTARTGVTHIKKHREERELAMMIMVDVSASDMLGSGAQTKKELAAEIASVIAFSANRAGDKAGLLLFSDKVESFIPPRKGRSHVFRIIREILYYQPSGKGTSLKTALDYFNLTITRSAVVFIVSDFLDQGYERALRVTNQKHDAIAVSVFDHRELELPDVGRILLEDAETGEIVEVNTADKNLRERFAGLDLIEVETGASYQRALKKFFEHRIRRAGR